MNTFLLPDKARQLLELGLDVVAGSPEAQLAQLMTDIDPDSRVPRLTMSIGPTIVHPDNEPISPEAVTAGRAFAAFIGRLALPVQEARLRLWVATGDVQSARLNVAYTSLDELERLDKVLAQEHITEGENENFPLPPGLPRFTRYDVQLGGLTVAVTAADRRPEFEAWLNLAGLIQS